VQLGTISVVIGDWLEFSCDPDWAEQELEVKIYVRKKSRNIVEICSGGVDGSRDPSRIQPEPSPLEHMPALLRAPEVSR
jgi:hypothetical protein